MRSSSEIAKRYAQALFEMSKEEKRIEHILQQLRLVEPAFSEKSVELFFASPLVSAGNKFLVVEKVINEQKLDVILNNFLSLLAHKNRLSLFQDIVQAFQDITDKEHSVVRGTVKSATILTPEQRLSVEQTVEAYTKKKVIMNYVVDKEVIGGLVADVGSFTFDDTITTHLNRLNEELNRSAH